MINQSNTIDERAGIKEVNLLAQKLSDELSKFTYFLLAAAGTCIGYALSQSEKLHPSMQLAPLVLSLLAWCISFYFGIRHLDLIRKYIIENAKCLISDVIIEQAIKTLEPFALEAQAASRAQYIWLIIGVVLYITWKFFAIFGFYA